MELSFEKFSLTHISVETFCNSDESKNAKVGNGGVDFSDLIILFFNFSKFSIVDSQLQILNYV